MTVRFRLIISICATVQSHVSYILIAQLLYKNSETRPISDGFRKNNVNYWAFREIRSIIPHL